MGVEDGRKMAGQTPLPYLRHSCSATPLIQGSEFGTVRPKMAVCHQVRYDSLFKPILPSPSLKSTVSILILIRILPEGTGSLVYQMIQIYLAHMFIWSLSQPPSFYKNFLGRECFGRWARRDFYHTFLVYWRRDANYYSPQPRFAMMWLRVLKNNFRGLYT
jgi:hypothetical protein